MKPIKTAYSRIRESFKLNLIYYMHHVRELEDEINYIRQTTENLSPSQEHALRTAEAAIAEAKTSAHLVHFWGCVNRARTQRARFTPDSSFYGLVLHEAHRKKDMFDDEDAQKWQTRLDELLSRLECTDTVSFDDREQLFRYFQQVGRKWNGSNAREDSIRRTSIQLFLFCIILLVIGLLVLNAAEAVVAVVFGALGGVVSAAASIRDWKVAFRTRRLDIDIALLLRPLIGGVVALMLLQFLESGISPITVQKWASDSNTVAIAAISFAAGLSERIVLGRLDFLQKY